MFLRVEVQYLSICSNVYFVEYIVIFLVNMFLSEDKNHSPISDTLLTCLSTMTA